MLGRRLVALIGQGVLLTAIAGLCLAPAFGEPSIIERERARRAARTGEAQEQLKRGDAAYEAHNYEAAVAAYASARDLLTRSSFTAELRKAATERYAQASVERARQLAKGGRRDDAATLLDAVLASDVMPGYGPAAQLKEQIFDPIRYNPALTEQTVREVDKVRRLLYEAEGFGQLGQFDRATQVYHEVLRIDPYNKAARRGMEAIIQEEVDYFSAAKDELRRTMLTAVDAAWATPVPPAPRAPDEGLGAIDDGALLGRTAQEKLDSLMVPMVDLTGASLTEAVDFLRQQSINLDTLELNEERRGISFVIDMGTGESPLAKRIAGTRIDLQLENVPLGEVLKYINSATRTRSRIDQHAVVIMPEGSISNELLLRRWRVPPDFLSREALAEGGDDNDPFAEKPKKALLGAKLSPKEFLQKKGVPFPEGATAGYTPFDSTLTVRNTDINLDFVDQIVNAIVNEEPVVVKVEVRFVNVEQDVLHELGFDWLLNGFSVNDDVIIGGGTVGNGTPINDFAPNLNPVTSGNRSGVAAQGTKTIDALIRAGSRSIATTDQDSVRGPGILSVAGVWGDEVIAVLMRGIGNDKGTDWTIKKSVLTRSGQSASIHSVREFIYPTEYEPPEIPNNVGGGGFTDLTTGESVSSGISIATPATPTAFEKRDTGCVLEVEPLVGPDRRYIEVSIRPEVTTFDGFVDYGTPINGGFSTPMINLGGIGNPNVPAFNAVGAYGQITQNSILMPVFSVTRSNTNLVLLDGSTIVLGGLLSESHTKYEDKVPVLGDLPLVGRFFTSNVEAGTKVALLIFVKVELLDPAGYRYRNR